MSDRLWVCHRCELIGNGFDAGKHVDITGHTVEELDEAVSDAVRAEQKRPSPLPTAADFIAYARFKQRIEGAFVDR